MKLDQALLLRRRLTNQFIVLFFYCTVAIALGVLFAILWELSWTGISALSLTIFLEPTPAPGTDGGLLNAIIGSVFLVITSLFIAIPLGVLAGTYLSEYGGTSKIGNAIRFCTDILLSAPSILVGLFVYGIIVIPTSRFSGWAGAAALCILALPVIVRTTEDMLQLIPGTLREAAVALGCPYWKMIVKIGWKSARAGIVTGILLALARISGETAPLLFTSLNNQFISLSMSRPIASLPTVIFQYAMSPYEDWQNLAWTGAFLIAVTVLGMNISARVILSVRRSR
jgi:phosphate transport system permease protein